MSLNENLGRRVDWFGRVGTIQGVWVGPTYDIAFDDGQDLVVGADKVSLLGTASANVHPETEPNHG